MEAKIEFEVEYVIWHTDFDRDDCLPQEVTSEVVKRELDIEIPDSFITILKALSKGKSFIRVKINTKKDFNWEDIYNLERSVLKE